MGQPQLRETPEERRLSFTDGIVVFLIFNEKQKTKVFWRNFTDRIVVFWWKILISTKKTRPRYFGAVIVNKLISILKITIMQYLVIYVDNKNSKKIQTNFIWTKNTSCTMVFWCEYSTENVIISTTTKRQNHGLFCANMLNPKIAFNFVK